MRLGKFEFYEISDHDVCQSLVKMILLQVLLVVTWDGMIGKQCQYLTMVTIMLFAVLPITALCGHPSIPLGTVILQPGEIILADNLEIL